MEYSGSAPDMGAYEWEPFIDCNGVVNGNAEIDDCGICNGFNQSCLNEIFLNGPEDVYAYINENIIELRWNQSNYPMVL